MNIPYVIFRRADMYILTFRLSMFGDFKRFTPTATNIISWTQALQDEGYEFLPTIIQPPQQSINIPFGTVQIGSDEKRLQFNSPEGNVFIRILAERVDIEFALGEADKPQQYFNEKIGTASVLAKLMLEKIGAGLGNRLAYYVDMVVPEPNNVNFDNFYKKYNLGISINAQTEKCVEWSHRFNQRIFIDFGNQSELSNAIFAFDSGTLQTSNARTHENRTIFGLHYSADINTLAENSMERFTADQLQSYAQKAQVICLNVLEKIIDELYAQG